MEKGTSMQQWEYCSFSATEQAEQEVLELVGRARTAVHLCTLEGQKLLHSVEYNTKKGDKPFDAKQSAIAWLGLQGWEVCGFAKNGDPLWFKRPKQD